jgi:hypothetical protein
LTWNCRIIASALSNEFLVRIAQAPATEQARRIAPDSGAPLSVVLECASAPGRDYEGGPW